MKPKLIVFSGAGMSAESGISTFRDSGALWERYRIEDVATPEAWQRNPELVLDFYNQRRRQMWNCSPNHAHSLLAEIESKFEVQIITQNIDNLHEKAGSQKVLHLHGELDKARSTGPGAETYFLEGKDILLGDLCPKGYQLRPDVVWFGEEVPAMNQSINLVETAEYFVVIGTSLQVYPAAGLVYAVQKNAHCALIDPGNFDGQLPHGFTHIQEKASKGLLSWLDTLPA